MKSSKFAVLACILVCAFLGGSVGLASAATPKVIVTPSKPAVILGKSQQFKANVTGVKNAHVTWLLDDTSVANGCTISASGLVTVSNTVTTDPDSWKPVVTAIYTGVTPNVSGTATFTVTDPAPAPGLFMGTLNCTGGSCNGEAFDLAMNVKKGGAIDVMVLAGTLTWYDTLHAAIILNKNIVHGTYKRTATETFTLEGQVEFDNGTADIMSGSLYTSGVVDPIGTWTVTRTTTGLAKVGTFTITDTSLFGRVINGKLAGMAIPPSTTTFYGLLEVPHFNVFDPISGAYDQSSNTVNFSSTIKGNTVTGTGTISPNGNISGDTIYNGKKVGTWKLQDI